MASLLARTRAGRPIHVNPADERGRRLVDAHGDLNPPSLELWQIALGLHPWRVVLDVGANYGEMLVGARLPAGAEVIAFEPNPDVRARLAETLRDNGLPAQLRPEAVTDEPGPAQFRIDLDWSGMSSLRPLAHSEHRSRVAEVAAVTLDQVLGDSARSFCVKVDVEGDESAVLAGARGSLATVEHWAVVAEVLHLSRGALAELAATHATFLLDRWTRRLVRVPGGNAELLGRMLASGWLYPQDCLLVSPALVVRAEESRR